MRFLPPSRLRIASFVLIVVTICVSLGYVGKATFALPSGGQTSVITDYGASGYLYTVVPTGANQGFQNPTYNDSAFQNGTAAFGVALNGCPLDSTIKTNWPSNTDILVRRDIDLPAGTTGLTLHLAVDNNAVVYWNGAQVGSVAHGGCAARDTLIVNVPNSTLVVGANVLAIRGTDLGASTYLDLQMVATTSTPTPISSPTPVSTPPPSLTEYLQASDAAYGLDKGAFVLPPGMTYVTESPKSQRAQGFEAVALQDSAGNIIIANEGTVPGPVIGTWTPYENGCLITDIAIGANYPPGALTEAIAFATSIVQMEKQQGSTSKIYVTGHSLGGIEAEAEAQALPAAIAGGATFGASGLPHNTTVNVPTTFINYIDIGDPVGNYASDAKSALNSLAPANMNHYGQVQLEGVVTNASYLQDAVLTKKVLSSDLIKALEAIGKLSPTTKAFFTSYNATMYASIAVYLGASVSKYHVITHYAADLQVNLTPIATVAPAISLDEYLKIYAPQASITDIKDAEAANVSSNGTLVSPEMTISFAPQKKLITSEKYMAPDSSVYNALMDGTETVTVVQVNQSTGGSYQAVYDTANRQTWSSYTNFYKGANETGVLTEAIYNWKGGGGSQVRLFTGLPRGVTEEIKNYSGPNGTGTLLSTQFK